MAIFRRLVVRKRVERAESVKAAVEQAYSPRIEVRAGAGGEMVSEPPSTTIENYYRDRKAHAVDDGYIAFFEAEVRKAMGE